MSITFFQFLVKTEEEKKSRFTKALNLHFLSFHSVLVESSVVAAISWHALVILTFSAVKE